MRGREDVKQVFPDCLSDLKAILFFFNSGKNAHQNTCICAFAYHANALGSGEGSEDRHQNIFLKRVFSLAQSCWNLIPPGQSILWLNLGDRLLYPSSVQAQGKISCLFWRFSCNRGLSRLSHSLLIKVTVQHGSNSAGEMFPAHATSAAWCSCPFPPPKVKLLRGGVPLRHAAPAVAPERAEPVVTLTQSYH